jgi:4-hydroxythreonine-4-phosphate dehydrogenase
MLPILALTTGDPAGIGPEVVCRALFSPEVQAVCRPLVIGDGAVLRRAAAACGLAIGVRDVVEAGAVGGPGDAGDPGRPLGVAVLDPLALSGAWEGPALTDLPLGAVSAAAGRASVAYVLRAIDLALAGEVAGIVTGPINKEAMNLAGYRYAGHTELLAERTGTREAAMMLVTGNAQGTLRVVHVTTHVALERVPQLVTPERLATVFELAEETMRRLGIAAPRIAVAGLNPHAGEHGLFGSQDADVIAPAVALARKRGWGFSGPWPPDTVFARAHRGQFDAVVAMYHDQGHIAIKMIGFDEGVNVSLGMPIVRTSVDHGTAFDIAGKGVASPVSMIQSIVLASRLAATPAAPAAPAALDGR